MKRAIAVAGLLLTSPANAHTRWADGTPVPEWVRNACCGPSDVHHLTAQQVRLTPEGYRVDGIQDLVPFCFFAPPTGF